MKVECKECKGYGWKYNWIGMGLLNVIAPLAWLIDRNSHPKDEITCTKETCNKCQGKGWVIW